MDASQQTPARHLMLADIPRYECLLELAKHVPDLAPLASEAYMHLIRTGDELYKVANLFLTKNGISQARFVVLILLSAPTVSNFVVPTTPAELADMVSCTRATMTGLIDTLEKDGMVTRQQDPNDRRMMRVRITTSGRAFIDRLFPQHLRRVSTILGCLTESEQRLLVGFLQKIADHAATIDATTETTADD
jgi:DNA-binding MarR family transcriptional regulator